MARTDDYHEGGTMLHGDRIDRVRVVASTASTLLNDALATAACPRHSHCVALTAQQSGSVRWCTYSRRAHAQRYTNRHDSV